MARTDFKVIIVGGGPVGLSMGHALAAAGINLTILERGVGAVPKSGAAIMLLPHSMRLFDQLGLYEAAVKVGMPVRRKTNTLLNGKFCNDSSIEDLETRFGYAPLNFNRTKLVGLLYDGLPDRENKVKTGCNVVDIERNDEGVRVILENGDVVEGSIVIGCDGVHSKVREIMQQHIAQESPDYKKGQDSQVVAHYQVLYGYAPYIPGITKHNFFETRGTGITTQMCASDDSIHFGLHKALPEPMTERKIYTEEETEEYVRQFADVMVMPGLKFRDLWPKCIWTRLVNQEEAFFERWHHGRIVLVGDAVHKMTTNAGMGLNCGLQSAVVLVNQLREVITKSENPKLVTLDAAFSRYQDVRQDEARVVHDFSTTVVQTVTWGSWVGWFMDQYLVPYVLGQEAMGRKYLQPLIARARVLDFVSKDELKSGEVPWAY